VEVSFVALPQPRGARVFHHRTMANKRFDDLYQRFDKLVAYVRRIGRPEEDARDLAQNAMIETWKRMDNIAPGAEWPYAQRVASSRAINQAKRTRKSEVLDEETKDEAMSSEDSLLAREFQRRFREVFSELPRITQDIFVLRRRGMTFEQIAGQLRIEPTAARSRASRAMPIFRERLGDPPPGVEWLEFGDDDDHES
jgi:RNA polymerase sigma factor (sigma-70 family)